MSGRLAAVAPSASGGTIHFSGAGMPAKKADRVKAQPAGSIQRV